MHPSNKLLSFSFFTFISCGAFSAHATILFDSTFYGDQYSHQEPSVAAANYGTASEITVSVATPITNFAVFTAQDGPGDLEFVIYDQTTSSFIYDSGSVPEPADNLSAPIPSTEKLSPTFALTLLPSDVYYIGALADSSTYYLFGAFNNPDTPPGPAQPVTQNGITESLSDILIGSFGSPALKATSPTGGVGELSLQLFDGPSIPEPSTWLLMATGLGALIAANRRRQSGV